MKILIYKQTDKNSLDCFRLRLRNDALYTQRHPKAKPDMLHTLRLCEGEA
jgi:hypothetical protein